MSRRSRHFRRLLGRPRMDERTVTHEDHGSQCHGDLEKLRRTFPGNMRPVKATRILRKIQNDRDARRRTK